MMEAPLPTRLVTACKVMNKNQLSVLRSIIQNGISSDDANATDTNGRTALSLICVTENTKILADLLQVPGIDINKGDNDGNTPLHYAAEYGRSDVIIMLLSRKFIPALKIDAKNNVGLTPLMKAAAQGRTDCCKKLILASASLFETDMRRGLNAQQWAHFCGRKFCADCIGQLIKKRNLKTSKTEDGSFASKIRRILPFVRTDHGPTILYSSVAKNESVDDSIPLIAVVPPTPPAKTI